MNSQIDHLLWKCDHERLQILPTITGRRTGLSMVSLRDFVYHYGEELEEYYGADFVPTGEEKWFHDNTIGKESLYTILCMVDFRGGDILTKKGITKKIKKAGMERRKKIKHRYSYVNPMNRIHGYIILKKEYIQPYPWKKVMTISVIATSPFSDKRGIGSDIMEIVIKLAKSCEYDDIILEVANDCSWRGFENEEEEEEEEEEKKEDKRMRDKKSRDISRRDRREDRLDYRDPYKETRYGSDSLLQTISKIVTDF